MAYHKSNLSFEKMLLKFIGEPDPMLSMLEWLCHKMMEIEVTNKLGASKNEHSDDRKGYLSGTRVRRFDTRMGTMYLLVPKVRKGGYVPFFVTEKKRSEQALLQVVQEAFVNGISTRKIERLAHSLGIESISASQVSVINKELNEQIKEFRERRLDDTYPVIWVDALYEKIRVDHRICNMAVLVVCGVNLDGKREILAVEPMFEESEATSKGIIEPHIPSAVKKGEIMHHMLQAACRGALRKCDGNVCPETNLWVIGHSHIGINESLFKTVFPGCKFAPWKVNKVEWKDSQNKLLEILQDKSKKGIKEVPIVELLPALGKRDNTHFNRDIMSEEFEEHIKKLGWGKIGRGLKSKFCQV